jgi:hypothetical protein
VAKIFEGAFYEPELGTTLKFSVISQEAEAAVSVVNNNYLDI